MALAMSHVRESSAPISHSPAEYSDCDSFDGMLVSEAHDKCFAAAEVEIVTEVAVSVEGDILWVDSQPTKPCCTLLAHSEQDNLIAVDVLAFDAGILKGR